MPRGGVLLGAEVARTLCAPLDVVMVRKIGVPFHPEFAVAVVVNGDHPELIVSERVAKIANLGDVAIERLADIQLKEIDWHLLSWNIFGSSALPL